ncbi:MAG: cell division protein FtsA [Robiginitomaculum sp.]|nr:MAG: cell division protein FtsA [Robiginitomaculum sp.]
MSKRGAAETVKNGAAGPAGLNSRQSAVGVLDIGASKVACFVARAGEAPRSIIRVAGVGHQSSKGLRSGSIIDLDAAEAAVRQAVEQAERMAGISINAVTLSYCGPSLRAQKVRGMAAINGREVNNRDVKRVMKTALAQWHDEKRVVIHAIPQRYSVDDNIDVLDPRGMFATRLGVEICIVSVDRNPLRNLALVVDRCRLDLRSIVATPYAAGLAALVDDEMHLGATVIDMGAALTSFAVFSDGGLAHVGAVPLGGQHVTNDIARGLSTPMAAAERIKTMYGTVLDGPDDDFEMIDCPGMCDDPGMKTDQAPRAVLTSVIRPRLEETFEMVRAQLEASGVYGTLGERVVLVGGASQLDGVRELAARMLNKQVRLGRPLRLSGLGDAVNGAGFAATAGIMHHVIFGPREAIFGAPDILRGGHKHHGGNAANPVQQLWGWLKDNF